MPPSAPASIALLVAGLALAPAAALAASSLDSYSLSAGGNSILGAAGPPLSCATFGPDPRAAIFGGGFQVGLPTDGSVCGVGADGRAASAGGGSVSTASSLAVGFGPPSDPRSFVGSGAGRAGYGNLGVSAAASYAGNSDSFTVAGSQSGARQIETMTFLNGVGAGTYRPTFTIDGSLFSVGRTDSEIEFAFASGSGPSFLTFRIMSAQGSLSLYANGGYQSSLPGMSITGDAVNGYTVAGSTTFSFDIPIVFGTAIDITYTMWGATLPRSNAGLLSPSAGDVAFLSTAKLTGIQVFDASGAAVDGFAIVSGSGTGYGPGGVMAAVPEPGTAALTAFGLIGLAARRLRSRGFTG